ncbi:MAG: hypothetical protein IT452_03315 [Planctomycetia bacterium]|nr:hypothetical protein [Planctomycetia bacterium]
MANKPRSWRRRIVFGILALLVLVVGGYAVAYRQTASDPAKLGAWGTDLDKALAEAGKAGKLVVVKAGSQY